MTSALVWQSFTPGWHTQMYSRTHTQATTETPQKYLEWAPDTAKSTNGATNRRNAPPDTTKNAPGVEDLRQTPTTQIPIEVFRLGPGSPNVTIDALSIPTWAESLARTIGAECWGLRNPRQTAKRDWTVGVLDNPPKTGYP